jgi:hypothetical protein
MESRLLVNTMNGILKPSPKRRRNRFPWDAPPTASILSSDMVMSAITMILIACHIVVACAPFLVGHSSMKSAYRDPEDQKAARELHVTQVRAAAPKKVRATRRSTAARSGKECLSSLIVGRTGPPWRSLPRCPCQYEIDEDNAQER